MVSPWRIPVQHRRKNKNEEKKDNGPVAPLEQADTPIQDISDRLNLETIQRTGASTETSLKLSRLSFSGPHVFSLHVAR